MSNGELKALQLAIIQSRVNDRLRNSDYHGLVFSTHDFAVLFTAFIEEFQKLQMESSEVARAWRSGDE